MRSVFIFMFLSSILSTVVLAREYSFILGGGAGSQSVWLKNTDTNIKYSNIDKELKGFSGGLSFHGVAGIQKDGSEKLFTRYLFEASFSDGPKVSDFGKLFYKSYGILVEGGYRLSQRFYAFGGPGVSYSSVEFKNAHKEANGVGINVVGGMGVKISDSIALEAMAKGAFLLGDKFKELGDNKDISMPVKLDYMLNIILSL